MFQSFYERGQREKSVGFPSCLLITPRGFEPHPGNARVPQLRLDALAIRRRDALRDFDRLSVLRFARWILVGHIMLVRWLPRRTDGRLDFRSQLLPRDHKRH